MSEVRRYKVTFYRYKRLGRWDSHGPENLGEFSGENTHICAAYSAEDALFQVELMARNGSAIYHVHRVEPEPDQ